MKVSFFVHNLSENPIVRTYPIAKTFEAMGWETEVLGLLFDGKGIYEPYKNSFLYKTINVNPTTKSCLEHATALSKRAEGDLVYACKPLITTFLPALKASQKDKGKPLLLDVEDNDVEAFKTRSGAPSILHSPTSYDVNHWLINYISRCCGVTVSSTHLRSIYGGKILLHGPPGVEKMTPIGSERQFLLRKKLRLSKEKILLLFAGKSRPHKGIRKAVDVLSRLETTEMHLVLAGDPSQPDFRYAKEKMGSRVTLLGEFNQAQMQFVNTACDIGLILQDENEYSRAQIPAKLLESFAHGRPVIATYTGDLPKLLGKKSGSECSRGWLIKGDIDKELRSIVDLIQYEIQFGSKILKEKSFRARDFYLKSASIEANRKILLSFPEINELHLNIGEN
jgi:glycosyltransferase involved in cell wall biosynthesis